MKEKIIHHVWYHLPNISWNVIIRERSGMIRFILLVYVNALFATESENISPRLTSSSKHFPKCNFAREIRHISFHISCICENKTIECTKTTSTEDVSTGVLEKKEYLRSKDKAKNDMMYQDIYNCICQNKKIKIYYPVCQTYSPTGV